MKKRLSALLAAALCLCLLPGCGAAGTRQAEETAAPEEIYVSSFAPLRFPEGVEPVLWAVTDEGVYAAAYEKLADGEVPEGKTLSYEGEYDVMGWRLYRAAEDGAAELLDYASLPAPEDAQGRRQYSASISVERLFPAPEGGLLAVEQQNESWYTGEEEWAPENADDYWEHVENRYAYTLRRLDAQGRVLESHPLAGPDEGAYLNFYSAALDGDGDLYVADEQSILVFAQDGSLLRRVDTGGNWPYALVRLKDGRVAMETWDDGMRLLAVDRKSGSLERIALIKDFAEHLTAGAGEYDFYYTSGTRFYGYDLAAQEAAELLDWLSCDLSADELQGAVVGNGGQIRAVSRTPGEAPEWVTLEKTLRGTVSERQVLTLGTLSPQGVSDAVLRFNRSQDAVRIELRDYSAYVGDDADSYEVGLQKLTTEIMAGDVPDLLALESLPYAQLAAKGLLEDLYPYLDADPDLARGDFFENVLHGMEVGGGLYQVSPGFTVITLMGPSDVVGDTPGWTYDEFDAVVAELPEGCTALGPEVGRDGILEMCTYLSLGDFVDWGTGRCDFDSEGFRRLLRFCAQFPKLEQRAYDEDSSDMSRIAEGRQLLVYTGLYNVDEAVYNDQYFSGRSTYIGFPTLHGTGNVLYPTSGYAMSAACADKEAGWSFLRAFFTQEYQEKYGAEIGLPLNRAAFRTALDEAMRVEYEKDAEGHYVLDANGERIPTSKGGISLSVGGGARMDFELWAMTQEQADKLLQVIETSDRAVDLNSALFGIVKSEAEAYFAGQKTAEEVARLVQSKASLYVSEQR
ncbi:MAG: extracellular solute-binding protein [Oscillospiraceae bacterium]|nr:extracellular solute-binding protein [Oscillospiraceae bacterium]